MVNIFKILGVLAASQGIWDLNFYLFGFLPIFTLIYVKNILFLGLVFHFIDWFQIMLQKSIIPKLLKKFMPWVYFFSKPEKPIYNHLHNIFRLLDVLRNFPFTTSEKMHDYYLLTWYTRVVERVAELVKTMDLRKLGNIRKVPKIHRMIAQCPAAPSPLPTKWIFC